MMKCRVALRLSANRIHRMTALAAELDRKLSQLDPERAAKLERVVREAMALAEPESAEFDWTKMQVHELKLSKADYEFLMEALDAPPRDLPRLRKLMQEPSIFGNA